MTKVELCELMYERFPNSVGVLLTGSQSKSDFFHSKSDIDVVVFDMCIPIVVTLEMFYREIKIDCTIIPIPDISNVLINESADSKGIILKMILTGEILYQKSTILSEVKDYVTSFFDSLKKDENPVVRKYLFELQWIGKYLERPIDSGIIFLLLCEMVNAVTILEALKFDYFLNTHLRKGELLAKNNSSFLPRVIDFFETARKGDVQTLLNFIKEYSEGFKAKQIQRRCYTINFQVDSVNIYDFVFTLLYELKKEPYFNQVFRFFSFPEKEAFKYTPYNISLTFAHSADMLNGKIVDHIKHFFAKKEQGFIYKIVFLPIYVDEFYQDEAVITLRTEFCKKISDIYQEDINRVFQFTKNIFKYLCSKLRLKKRDKLILCDLLVGRLVHFSNSELASPQFSELYYRRVLEIRETISNEKGEEIFYKVSEDETIFFLIDNLLSKKENDSSSVLSFFPESLLLEQGVDEVFSVKFFIKMWQIFLSSTLLSRNEKAIILIELIDYEG